MAPGGGHGADFTGDGLPDVLARERGTGKLKVYPHSGTFDGTATYPSVVTINLGWQGMRWIGAADVTGDGFADVVAIDQNWRMVVAEHSGVFNGTGTLLPGLTVVGHNWHVNDLLSVVDTDTYDYLVARRAGDGKIYRYANHAGLNGTATFDAPETIWTGGWDEAYRHATFIGMSALYRGGDTRQFVYRTDTGELHSQDTYFHYDSTIGHGWQHVEWVVLANLDGDYYPDVLAREKGTGRLLAYLHSDEPGEPEETLLGPEVIGYGWQVNDIIT